ncbi:hypothetical protein F5B19DRAFT_249257 [Rostrohypoxylon terebratum]|nr:hypothetical protein F5B19DRAFT_249257 [Rostrohypoxylon terebratum]
MFLAHCLFSFVFRSDLVAGASLLYPIVFSQFPFSYSRKAIETRLSATPEIDDDRRGRGDFVELYFSIQTLIKEAVVRIFCNLVKAYFDYDN